MSPILDTFFLQPEDPLSLAPHGCRVPSQVAGMSIGARSLHEEAHRTGAQMKRGLCDRLPPRVDHLFSVIFFVDLYSPYRPWFIGKYHAGFVYCCCLYGLFSVVCLKDVCLYRVLGFVAEIVVSLLELFSCVCVRFVILVVQSTGCDLYSYIVVILI